MFILSWKKRYRRLARRRPCWSFRSVPRLKPYPWRLRQWQVSWFRTRFPQSCSHPMTVRRHKCESGSNLSLVLSQSRQFWVWHQGRLRIFRWWIFALDSGGCAFSRVGGRCGGGWCGTFCWWSWRSDLLVRMIIIIWLINFWIYSRWNSNICWWILIRIVILATFLVDPKISQFRRTIISW